MAFNHLTGDFEAVFQVAVPQINALLGTLHQNGATPEKTPSLLHSVRLSVGGAGRVPDVGGFGEWILEARAPRRGVSAPGFRGDLIGDAPPGAAARLRDTFAIFDNLVAVFQPADVVRGFADVQLSTITITVPEGSTSEVVIHAHIRAAYQPAPGTANLPAPIHGEVAATFEIRRQESESGRRLLIKPSGNDAKIQFHPAPGTVSGGDAAVIAAQIRRALREEFTLVPVDLPSAFPFGAFKGVGSGAAQAIALGMQLTPGAAAPPGGLIGVAHSLTGPGGFAFAVSKAFLRTVLAPAIDSLEQFEQDVPVPVSNVPYKLKVTSVVPDFNSGSIDLRIRARATHPTFPEVLVTIRQRITLVLFLDRLFLAAPNNELSVQASAAGIPFPTGFVRGRVIAARNDALPPAQDALNTELAAARARMNEALRLFDPAASMRFRAGHSEEPGAASTGAIAITPDGVIVRGDFGLSSRDAPVIDIGETADETAFTALETWIPAGRVDRLFWSWIEYPNNIVFGAEAKSLPPVEHHFLLPKPPGVTSRSQVCLRVEGTVIAPNGSSIAVSGGTVCKVSAPDTIMHVPSWWEPVMVPLWGPGIPLNGVVRSGLTAHVSVQADTAGPDRPTHNSLVYFPDWEEAAPLAPLGEALKQLQRRGASLVVFVVLPVGAFDARRRELEAKLAAIDREFAANLHVTEDDQGGWTRTFAPNARPAAFLINARHEFDWKYEGALAPREFAAALDRRLQVAPPPRFVPLRLKATPGYPVVDASFPDDTGELVALHRLRGERLVLNFWLEWSEPCRSQLRRLRVIQERAAKEPPRIVAFHGGAKDDRDRIRKELKLPFTLVHDVDQKIARAFGVRCWPTTVYVNQDGRVDHVQFGLTPTGEREVDSIY